MEIAGKKNSEGRPGEGRQKKNHKTTKPQPQPKPKHSGREQMKKNYCLLFVVYM